MSISVFRCRLPKPYQTLSGPCLTYAAPRPEALSERLADTLAGLLPVALVKTPWRAALAFDYGLLIRGCVRSCTLRHALLAPLGPY